jgi:hypothetical protein
MVFFGHVGISVFAADRLFPNQKELFRTMVCVTFCAVLPDLLDKPIRYLGWSPEPTGRLWGHTLLFSVAWCLLCASRLRGFWPWALATPGHLVLDGMFRLPKTLFWPFLGFGFEVPDRLFAGPIEQWLWLVDHEPLRFLLSVLFPELLGFVLFVFTLRRVRRLKRNHAIAHRRTSVRSPIEREGFSKPPP